MKNRTQIDFKVQSSLKLIRTFFIDPDIYCYVCLLFNHLSRKISLETASPWSSLYKWKVKGLTFIVGPKWFWKNSLLFSGHLLLFRTFILLFRTFIVVPDIYWISLESASPRSSLYKWKVKGLTFIAGPKHSEKIIYCCSGHLFNFSGHLFNFSGHLFYYSGHLFNFSGHLLYICVVLTIC